MTAVLALDLATKTGWALHKPGMERPFFGTLQLPRTAEEVGEPMERLRVFLADQHTMHGGLTDLVFEAQHVAGKIDINVVRKLLGLGGMCEWFAHRIGARCYVVHIGTWRKHFLGRGNMNRESAKLKAMDECRRLGIDPPDDNAAEAMGILDYYLSLKRLNGAPYPRPWRDAGFMRPLGAHG